MCLPPSLCTLNIKTFIDKVLILYLVIRSLTSYAIFYSDCYCLGFVVEARREERQRAERSLPSGLGEAVCRILRIYVHTYECLYSCENCMLPYILTS